MILRKFIKHVTDQNWFAVGLDVLVVILGVYLGIVLGTIQQKSQTLDAVHEGLLVIKSEMDSDITRLDEIIAFQKFKASTLRDTIVYLDTAEDNQKEIDKRLRVIFGDNDTFFPTNSAYLGMQSSGYFTAMTDEKLRLDIIRLYERIYVRQSFNAANYDDILYEAAPTEVFPHWDRAHMKLQHVDPDNITIVTNWMHLLLETSEAYYVFLETVIRPKMVKISADIHSSQEGKNDFT